MPRTPHIPTVKSRKPFFKEKREFLNLAWLNHQYYDLGISLQDIASDQGVSMMTIRKFVDKIDRPISEKKEIKPITYPIREIEGKSIKTCPQCGQKLYSEAIYCIKCGKKVEEDQVTPIQSEERSEIITGEQVFAPISKLIKDMSSQKPVTDKLHPKVEEMPPIPGVSEKKEEKAILEVLQVKAEEIQPTPPFSEKMEEKSKVFPYFCKFCLMELNNKATFCPQCGTRVKKK